MDGSRGYHSKWNKSDGERQIVYINELITNRIRLTGIENKLLVTKEERRSKINEEFGVNRCTWLGSYYYIYYYTSTTSTACLLSCFSRVWLLATLWTIACQVPLSMKFSRQEYWRGLPFPTPGNLPDPGIKPASPASPTWAGGFLPLVPPGKSPLLHTTI